jgi:hypothetical protein
MPVSICWDSIGSAQNRPFCRADRPVRLTRPTRGRLCPLEGPRQLRPYAFRILAWVLCGSRRLTLGPWHVPPAPAGSTARRAAGQAGCLVGQPSLVTSDSDPVPCILHESSSPASPGEDEVAQCPGGAVPVAELGEEGGHRQRRPPFLRLVVLVRQSTTQSGLRRVPPGRLRVYRRDGCRRCGLWEPHQVPIPGAQAALRCGAPFRRRPAPYSPAR